MYSGPVSGYRSLAPGSDRRSLYQPKRTSFTELLVTTEVHEALPYLSCTVEFPLLPSMLPLVNTAWVWMPCGETHRIAFKSKLNVLRSVGCQSSLTKPSS